MRSMLLLRALVTGLVAIAAAGLAAAQDYPSRLIKLVVGGAAGGGVDIVARIIQNPLAENLRQSVVIENRTGAGGFVGAAFVARAAADGYTMLTSTSGAIANALEQKVTYDVDTSFQPVSRIMASPFFLVVPQNSKINSVAELVAAGRDPKQIIRYGHPGPGTATHLATAYFGKMSGAHFEPIPYHSAAGQVTDTLSGQVQFGLLAAPDAMSRQNQGLRILAVTTAQRSVLAPDIPTIAESGVPGYETELWHGLFVPAQTPRAVVERIRQALGAAQQHELVQSRFRTLGMIATLDTPEEFSAIVEAVKKRERALARELNLKAP